MKIEDKWKQKFTSSKCKKKQRHLERKKTRILIQANKNKKELEELIENVILITSCEMGCLPWYDKTWVKWERKQKNEFHLKRD